MRRINILYVITKLELGGAQKQLLCLISNLGRERFNPFLFTARDGLLICDALSIKGLALERSRFLERRINPFKDILALMEIYCFIKKNNIQIVHTHSSKAGILGRLAARLAKVEIIIHTVHGWSFHDFQPFLLRKAIIYLERFAAHFTDKIIVVSEHDRQKGLNNHIGRHNQYYLIRYGINYPEFSLKDQNIRKELGIGAQDLVVGMVSCFKPQKSPQDFVKLAHLANQILPGIKFLLVGDGILRSNIEQLINKLGLGKSVILTGWRRDVNRIMSAIDIFVLTSRWEGLPITVLEAMASSKPVVATHTGGVAEVIVEAKTGFLVSPGDIKGMSERLSRLINDRNLSRQLGENAKSNLGLSFMVANTVKNTQDLYCSLFEQ